MKKLFLGIDQGSQSTKGVLIDQDGKEVFSTTVKVEFLRRTAQEVEQDGELLFESVQRILRLAQKFSAENKVAIEGMGLACQRSGVVAWDKESGRTLSPLLTWADIRSKSFLDTLGNRASAITELTSLPVTPHYAGGKIRILQQQYPTSSTLVGTLDSFLLYKLTEGRSFSTDDSMSARTMLYDIKLGAWSAELCKLFQVTEDRLPRINPSICLHGHYQDLPIYALLGDQQSSLLGVYSSDSSSVLTLGTIASLSVGTGPDLKRREGYVSSVLFSTPKMRMFLIEGVSNACGGIIEFLKTENIASSPEEIIGRISE